MFERHNHTVQILSLLSSGLLLSSLPEELLFSGSIFVFSLSKRRPEHVAKTAPPGCQIALDTGSVVQR